MLKKLKNKLNKNLKVFVLAGLFLLPQNIYANNQLNISSWAIPTLNEGEKYGLFHMDWYLGDFTGSITPDKLDHLLTSLENKIYSLDLPIKENFISHYVDYNEMYTRGNIITQFYNILDKYEYGQEFDNPIDYVTKKNIVIGDGDSLNLDDIASTEEAVVIATKFIETIYNDLDAGSKGFIWQVENKGNKVYLLGSIHTATSDIYPLNQKLKDAFDSADDLYVEVNLLDNNSDVDAFLELAMYEDGSSIRDEISQETYEKLSLVCDVLEISLNHMEAFKPWSIANDLTTFSSTESQTLDEMHEISDLGIDMFFLTRSLVEDKKINELESYEIQGMLFDNISTQLQEANLDAVLNNILKDNIINTQNELKFNNVEALLSSEIPFENIASLDNFDYVFDDLEEHQENNVDYLNNNQIIENWLNYFRDGDIDGIRENFIQVSGGNEYTEALLTNERDENMADKISELLEANGENTHFVVVGAAHFLLDGSILDLLEEKGYKVEFFY